MAVHYSEGLRYTYSRHRLVRALLRLLVVVSIAALLFSSTAADAKLECPEIYELYNITRILTTPPRPIDCYVEGEMPGLFVSAI
jgi:hypothetical protein